MVDFKLFIWILYKRLREVLKGPFIRRLKKILFFLLNNKFVTALFKLCERGICVKFKYNLSIESGH